MTERPQIDLEPGRYGEVHPIPPRFGRSRDMWYATTFCAVLAVVASYVAWRLGTFWAALIPIPFAAGIGIGLAGLYPRKFFGPSGK